jgi:hypothetical protein
MNRFYSLLYIGTILLGLFIGATQHVAASGEDFYLIVSPTYPKAGQQFTVEARTLTFDRARADIKWYLNGILYSSGVGRVEETFITSQIGSSMTIQAAATTPTGSTYQDEVVLSISSIDFIVSADTYTPPLYRGAAWPTIGSNITVYAVPHLFIDGKRLKTEDLVYVWKLNDDQMRDQSGGGKNKLSFFIDNFRNQPHKITLVVSDRLNTVQFRDAFEPTMQSPKLLFYEYRPLLGPSSLASNSFQVNSGDTISVLAEPYFFGLNALKRATLAWTLNGNPVEGSAQNLRLLDLVAPPDSNFQGSLRLSIKDPKSLFQRAENKFLISSKGQ